MRKIITIIPIFFTLVLSGVSYGQTGEQIENCKGHSGFAENVMTARQGGIPMSEIMDIAKGIDDDIAKRKSVSSVNYAKLLVLEAYKESAYTTEEYQHRAITDFADMVYMGCINGAIKQSE